MLLWRFLNLLSPRRFRHLCLPELHVSLEPLLVLELFLELRRREPERPRPRPFPFREPFESLDLERNRPIALERDRPRMPAIAKAFLTVFSWALLIVLFFFLSFLRFLPVAASAFAFAIPPPPGVMTLLIALPLCNSS